MGRLGIFFAAIPIIAAVILVATPQPMKDPLWPNSRFTELDRQRSILRGLEFIYSTASNPKHFEANGDDLLWCFYSLSAAAADPELKKRAWRMGQERAHAWRRTNAHVPPDAGASEIASLVYGSMSAEALDVRDEVLKTELRAASPRHKPEEYLQFDPTKEPPPDDIPRNCTKCRSRNPRGVNVCRKCGAELRMTGPYDILCDALTTAFRANRYGVWLGGSYEDVVQWIPKMRPYPRPENCTLYRLRPELLPQEYEYLKVNFKSSIAGNDPETLGEFMDTLRAFGMDESDPLMRSGVEFLLAHQNPDGSWGNKQKADAYVRYHTTWTAMNGTMQYASRGERATFPEVLRRIRSAGQ
jgi:hypothetical protein